MSTSVRIGSSEQLLDELMSQPLSLSQLELDRYDFHPVMQLPESIPVFDFGLGHGGTFVVVDGPCCGPHDPSSLARVVGLGFELLDRRHVGNPSWGHLGLVGIGLSRLCQQGLAQERAFCAAVKTSSTVKSSCPSEVVLDSDHEMCIETGHVGMGPLFWMYPMFQMVCE